MSGQSSVPSGTLLQEFGTGIANLASWIGGVGSPSLRIGITGLSRAGKTVFITGLVHALVSRAKLPAFKAQAEGRISRAHLVPYPDDAIPRFAYDEHIARLTAPDRDWPHSTRSISALSLEIAYESRQSHFAGLLGPAGVLGSKAQSLRLDIVDYPGEWLLDLPLLGKSYAEWSSQTLALLNDARRRGHFQAFLTMQTPDADVAPPGGEEASAATLAAAFTDGLRAARGEGQGLGALPPGRFLMPGDLEGAPMLQFAPLLADQAGSALGALMERRFEAYKARVIRPFYRDHFATLDRQIVLVDVLSSINGGKTALADLETALTEVLLSFHVGADSLFSSLFQPKVSKLLFAATKADHLSARNHDRLEAILRLLVRRAYHRAEGAGAKAECLALSAIRATREAEVKQGGEVLPCVAGIPKAGEMLDGIAFDGIREAVVYPGDLPDQIEQVFSGKASDLSFIAFRPPLLEAKAGTSLPSLRLDRALEFLIGDALI